ncbi:Extracellular serine protease precursor [Planctomycetes bacterium CA13]|uniref:Extracellular serine protease n=1 Tax=Novipirellula herctigrandis TaxID=2527986 RepID=A0A5C5ZAI7_9BACT|nr:Extracellular serine protease precursor [Planctomycetes bacterium CA13]
MNKTNFPHRVLRRTAELKRIALAAFLLIGANANVMAGTVTTTADSGAGSLRQVLLVATPDEVIDFATGLSGQTITLLTPLPTINENLTIDSSAATALTISGSDLVTSNSSTLTLNGDANYIGNAEVGANTTLIIAATGTITGNASVAAGGTLTSNGLITGDADVSTGATATITGTVNGMVVVDGNLTVDPSGTINGNTTLRDGAMATVQGAINGNVAVDGIINVPAGGTITGNTTLVADAVATIDGTINGDVVANGGSQFNVGGVVNGDTNVLSGAITNVSGFGIVNGVTNIVTGGTLIGNGTLAGDTSSSGTLNSGGTGAIDTLNFGNNLTVDDGNVQVDINADGTVPGTNNDLYAVTGNVNLNGGTVNVNALDGIYTDGMEYTFLTSGGTVTGVFAGITENLPFYTANLNYDPASVSFTLVDDPTATFAAIGDSCNQVSVGAYLDTLRTASPSGDLQHVIDSLKSSTTDSIQANLDQLGGQIYPSLVAAQLQHTSFTMAMLRDQLILDTMYRQPDELTRGWVRGYGIGGDADRDDCGTPGFNYSLGGTELGLQRGFANGLDLGLFLNMGWSNVTTIGVAQDADVDSYQYGGSMQYIGGYGYLLGIAGGGNQEYQARRTITNTQGMINRVARSEFDGTQGFGSLEYGTLIQSGATSWVPHFAMQYISLDQDEIHETGADSVNLVGDSIDADSLRSILGLSIQQTAPTSIGPATTKLRFGWMHEYLDTHETFVANFQDETESVSVRGIDLGRDWAVLGINLEWSILQHFTTVLGYQGQVNSIQSLHTGLAGLEARW